MPDIWSRGLTRGFADRSLTVGLSFSNDFGPLGACGGRKLCRGWSCGVSVLVNESVAAGRLGHLEVGLVDVGGQREGWSLIERAVRPVSVVVLDVSDDEPFELVLVPDDGAVEELSAGGADPACGGRILGRGR